MVQHLAMFEFIAVSATVTDRVLEYVDNLHEHFTDPVRVTGGRYLALAVPGFSTTLRPESLRTCQLPYGSVWQQIGSGMSCPTTASRPRQGISAADETDASRRTRRAAAGRSAG